jgi:hypothetical protein
MSEGLLGLSVLPDFLVVLTIGSTGNMKMS